MSDYAIKQVLDNPRTCRMMFDELKKRGVRFSMGNMDADARWLEHEEMRAMIIEVMRELEQREAYDKA